MKSGAVGANELALRFPATGDFPLIFYGDLFRSLSEVCVGFSLADDLEVGNSLWLMARPEERARGLLRVAQPSRIATIKRVGRSSLDASDQEAINHAIAIHQAEISLGRVRVASPGFIQINGNGAMMKELRALIEYFIERKERGRQAEAKSRHAEAVARMTEAHAREAEARARSVELTNTHYEQKAISERVDTIERSTHFSPAEKRRLIAGLVLNPILRLESTLENGVVDATRVELVDASDRFPDETETD